MELQNVQYFLALCEEQNFVRAAKRCGITQPTLTTAIKRLERHLGGALFERRPTQPTLLGLALKPYFEQIVLNVDLAQDEARRILAAQDRVSAELPASLSVLDNLLADPRRDGSA